MSRKWHWYQRLGNIQTLSARVLAGEIPGVVSVRIEPERLVLHPVLSLPLDGTWRITDHGLLDFTCHK